MEAQVTMDEVMLLRDSSATIIIIIVGLFVLGVYDLNFVCAFNELITITVRVFVVWCGVVVHEGVGCGIWDSEREVTQDREVCKSEVVVVVVVVVW